MLLAKNVYDVAVEICNTLAGKEGYALLDYPGQPLLASMLAECWGDLKIIRNDLKVHKEEDCKD